MTRPITHVATTDISDMMTPGSERRMDLPGFDPEFVDFPHYIIRITERIWHDREIDLCLKWYAEDCAIHTLAGDISGAQTVVDNTRATLSAFPDRRLDADNVIWSGEDGGAFYSSHLITSKMTNDGPSELGPATGKSVRIQTIAECLCKHNRVIEEWLVRDNLALVRQLGFDPDVVALRQAKDDEARGFNLIEFHRSNRTKSEAGASAVEAHTKSAETAVKALKAVWHGKAPVELAPVYDFRVAASYPGGRQLYGPDQIFKYMAPLLRALSDIHISIDHIAEIPFLGDARDVSLRWSVSARHTGDGAYGPATGAPVYILGVSHHRVMNGRVREDISIWDDLAVRRQIETARLGH
jgi:predicted ester cyclase